jgi:hypothetical protein
MTANEFATENAFVIPPQDGATNLRASDGVGPYLTSVG